MSKYSIKRDKFQSVCRHSSPGLNTISSLFSFCTLRRSRPMLAPPSTSWWARAGWWPPDSSRRPPAKLWKYRRSSYQKWLIHDRSSPRDSNQQPSLAISETVPWQPLPAAEEYNITFCNPLLQIRLSTYSPENLYCRFNLKSAVTSEFRCYNVNSIHSASLLK